MNCNTATVDGQMQFINSSLCGYNLNFSTPKTLYSSDYNTFTTTPISDAIQLTCFPGTTPTSTFWACYDSKNPTATYFLFANQTDCSEQ